MRLLIILIIVGLVAVAAVAAIFFLFLKPSEEWAIEVTPSDEIVIKGPVGRVAKKQVFIKCLKGDEVKINVIISKIAQAFVKPKSLTLNEGELGKTTLIVKISKLGEQKGVLIIVYGEKKEEIPVKVIGLPTPSEEEEQKKKEHKEGKEQPSGEIPGMGWLNFTIIADVKITGSTSGTLMGTPPTTYESRFTTTYTYVWIFYLTKKGEVSDSTLYAGWVELKEVSIACTDRYYYQLTESPELKAEVTVTVNGCINKLPEGQSLSTSIEAVIDREGRIVHIKFGDPEWYLGDIQGTQVSVVQTPEKTVSGTTSVTEDFWLTAIPIEALINTLKPKIGDKAQGIVNTNTEEYPTLLGQYYLCDPKVPQPITISGSLEIIKI
ncbi:MAG: hypothetical protein DRJ37_04100 [Thermoprotei archaeon]|nr:MAG: hypothetical protein DRJ37_04100 [Thermoprotei archaeon]